MAKVDYESPGGRQYVPVPKLEPGKMEHIRPYVAKPEHNADLGFPGELVDDWHDKAIAKMGELLKKYRSLQVFMDTCVKCGACTDKCHYMLGTAEPKLAGLLLLDRGAP